VHDIQSFTKAPVTVGNWVGDVVVGLDVGDCVGDCVGVVAVHVLVQAKKAATANAMRLTMLCGDFIFGSMMSVTVSHRPIVASITSPLRHHSLGVASTK
jgi:hypothetical protein